MIEVWRIDAKVAGRDVTFFVEADGATQAATRVVGSQRLQTDLHSVARVDNAKIVRMPADPPPQPFPAAYGVRFDNESADELLFTSASGAQMIAGVRPGGAALTIKTEHENGNIMLSYNQANMLHVWLGRNLFKICQASNSIPWPQDAPRETLTEYERALLDSEIANAQRSPGAVTWLPILQKLKRLVECA